MDIYLSYGGSFECDWIELNWTQTMDKRHIYTPLSNLQATRMKMGKQREKANIVATFISMYYNRILM